VAVPQTWEGWAATAGIVGPAIVFARLCGDSGQLLAIGLCAFLFGLAYAMAEENRLVPYQPPRRRDPPPVATEVLSL
jgi:hypothetical protein